MKKQRIWIWGLLFAWVSSLGAVQLNHRGQGEVLIYPYYTVNNNLNTLYSVVNTTADSKAIKVSFLEGDIGLQVLTFNIYLSEFDVWTGALVPSISTIGSHTGIPSATHLTADTSCAPYLVKWGQEILPYTIDMDIDPENRSISRGTEGHIEIIEMGVLTGAAENWVDHGNAGVPASCGSIQAEWDDGSWNSDLVNFPSGGLQGSAFIVNVGEGMSFSYDAIALQNFWQGSVLHTDPGSLEPDLGNAFPESSVMLPTGELLTTQWEHGYQAVSAVLTKTQLINEYAFDAVINGKTEWVLGFPTKGFHSNDATVVAPFNHAWDGDQACESVDLDLWNREAFLDPSPTCGNVTCPPELVLPQLCKATNVLSFLAPGVTPGNESRILGSDNLSSFTGINRDNSEGGWVRVIFPDAAPANPLEGAAITGLPVTGFAVMQFTNAAAAQGLLAQYGSLFKHKYMLEVDE